MQRRDLEELHLSLGNRPPTGAHTLPLPGPASFMQLRTQLCFPEGQWPKYCFGWVSSTLRLAV